MTKASPGIGLIASIVCGLLLATEAAHALRCGTRLVKDGMLVENVIEICGEPASLRDLGYVLRPYIVKVPAGKFGMHATRRVYGGYHEELLITELVYNFGPQKLMRILRFEGRRLTSIETAGYGYREKS